MCNCEEWVRDIKVENYHLPNWVPLAKHHPACEDFKLELFFCVLDECDSLRLVRYTEGLSDESDIDDIMLTLDQFEGLQEFQGY